MKIIILDSGPLGLITNPKLSPESVACAQWLQGHITSANRTIIPEIADYEVRRELLRANKKKGIVRLDDLARSIATRITFGAATVQPVLSCRILARSSI